MIRDRRDFGEGSPEGEAVPFGTAFTPRVHPLLIPIKATPIRLLPTVQFYTLLQLKVSFLLGYHYYSHSNYSTALLPAITQAVVEQNIGTHC